VKIVGGHKGKRSAVTASAKQELTEGREAIRAMRTRSKNNGVADMSMDDIDAEIAQMRAEKHGN
jgi:hypothetical protein